MKTNDSAVAKRGDASEPQPVSQVLPGNVEQSRWLVQVPDPFRPVHGGDARPIALADLLTDASIEHVRQTAYRLQSKWYGYGRRDFTDWNGFSLGNMVAGAMLRNELHGALSNYVAYHELLQRHPNATHIDVRHDPGIVPRIWQHECNRHGINFRLVADDTNGRAPEVLRRRPLRQRLTNGLTRLLSLVQGQRKRQTAARPLAMLISGSLTCRHSEFCAALDRSPHINVLRNRDVLSAGQRRGINRRTSQAAKTHFAELWDGLQRELRRGGLLDGVTRGGDDHVISILRDTFLHRLPQVASVVETARATLASLTPSLVIAEAQPGNDDYVWSSVAGSLGIPVVSITNELWGLPIHAYNFPPVSDYVLLTSPLSRSWWLERGFSEEAILPTRCRYLDAPKHKSSARSRFVALCAVTRYGPDLMDVPVTHPRRFVQSILSIAHTRPDIQFIVKFHPGTPRLEGQASFARQIAFVTDHSPPNVEIAPLDSSLSSYLRSADCLVCSSSSFTIFEALAQRIPCILAPPRSAILDQCPFFHAMKRHSRVTDLENIATEIDVVKNDGNEIPASWSQGVFYSEPAPSEVVEQLALRLNRQRVRGRTAA